MDEDSQRAWTGRVAPLEVGKGCRSAGGPPRRCVGFLTGPQGFFVSALGPCVKGERESMRVQRIATVDELPGAYSVSVRHDGFDALARRVHLSGGDGGGEEA